MSNQPSFKILVPVSSSDQVANILPLVVPLAQVRSAQVQLLHVELSIYGRGQQLDGAENWLVELEESLLAQSIQTESLHRTAHNLSGTIREVVDELNPDLLLLSWSRPLGPFVSDEDVDLQSLLLDVPCDLVVWRGHDHPPTPRRILIPSSGGPNASLAMQLADALADTYEGEITVLSVLPTSADESTIADMRESLRDDLVERLEKIDIDAEEVHINLVQDRSPTAGILNAAASGDYDLLMIGASREGVLNRLVFGEVPEKVALQANIPVLVIKRPLSRTVTVVRKVWEGVTSRAPRLTEVEKIDAYREIRRNARPDIDFYTMMALSTAIATLGVLLDSAAVVIGAMLVAPLMSAIIPLGLGVVQGDARLLRLATGSTLRGVLIAVVIALTIGIIVPGDSVTAEMASRASPSLLDLGVALASGAAAAYALSRKDMSASLPGVAIAVALVPPLAVLGLSLSQGQWGIAAGSSLLFATNLVAIAAMGGFVFLLLGFQPEPGRRERMLVFTRMWQVLIILLLIISLPLAWLTVSSFGEAKLQHTLHQTLIQEFEEMPGIEFRDYDASVDEEGVLNVSVEVESTRTIHHHKLVELQEQLVEVLNRPVALVLKIIPTTRLDSLEPPTPTPDPTITVTPTAAPPPTPTDAPVSTDTHSHHLAYSDRNPRPECISYSTARVF